MELFLEKAKSASRALATMSGSERNRILREMAEALRANTMSIIESNALDMRRANEENLASSLKERLLLDEKRIDAMAVAIEEIAALKDPIGRVIEGWVTDAGLKIEK